MPSSARPIHHLLVTIAALGAACGAAETAPVEHPAHSGVEEAAPTLPAGCREDCVTPYGNELGRNEGVVAYSNCSFDCVAPVEAYASPVDTGLTEPTYTGLEWQCVEYARRWWLMRLGIVFDSVDTADDMWRFVNHAVRPGDPSPVPVTRHENGGTEPPHPGDLIIYAADSDTPQLRFGHVAVVVGVDRALGVVSVAEQNFDNNPWTSPTEHARRLQLTSEAGRFRVREDAEPSPRIYGWLRPQIGSPEDSPTGISPSP